MIVSEIFIENRRVDISQDLSALLTFAIDDIKDFASRNTTFSKTIVLPGTSNNNALFGNIFDARVSNPFNPLLDNIASNFNASVSADCIIFQNHIQVFKGTLRIIEIVVTDGVPEYECAVVGELGGLVSKMAANKLEQLDFSAYNHVYNVTNIQASWDAAPGAGYFYPLIDYGDVSTNKVDYDIFAFRPAIYVKDYIDKIFAAAGYTYESALMGTERFKRLVIPHNQKDLRYLTSSLVTASGITSYDAIEDGVAFTAALTFPFFNGNGFTINGGNDRITYTDTPTLNCILTFNIDGFYIGDGGYIELLLRKNGGAPIAVASKTLDDNAGQYDPYNWSASFDITLAQNDYLEWWVEAWSGISGQYLLVAGERTISITTQYPTYVPLNNGDDLIMNDTIPKNILQRDLLSSVVKLFNLYIYEDNVESKHVKIEPYVDFYDLNVSGIQDWTYKLDRSKPVRYRPMSELNSRYYDFKFKTDNDYYNELYRKKYNKSYGDRIYDSQYEGSNDKTEVQLIFSPSVSVGYVGTDKVVPAFYKLTNLTTEEAIDVNIRILQTKKVTGVTAWDIENGSGGDLASNLTAYGYGGHYDDPDAPANDIHFGVPDELFFALVSGSINITQFNVYWSPYMAEITDKDSKMMIAYFKLITKDIYDLDFRKFIHVDGSYWRLNKITDWNASEPDTCQVELLKLINMIY